MYFKRIAPVLAIALIAACGSDSESSQTDDPKKPSVVSGATDEADAIAKYFEAMAGDDMGEMDSALDEAAAPGSVAHAYLTYVRAVQQADVDAGVAAPVSDSDLDKNDDGYELCQTPLDGSEEVCLDYADIETDDGKVASFTIDGVDISQQLAIGDGAPIFSGELADVTLIAGYKSVASNSVFVVMDVRSKSDPLSLNTYSATYRNPDGRQKTALGAVGPTDLAPDSLATVYIAFEDAEFGGEMALELVDSESFMKSETVSVPVQ